MSKFLLYVVTGLLVAQTVAWADKPKPMSFSYPASDGTTVDIEKMRGHVVLIFYWATWSAPSRDEVKVVTAVRKKYKDQGFEVVGVCGDKDSHVMDTFTDEYNMNWPEFCDGNGMDSPIFTQMGVKSLPTLWLVGKDGILVSLDATKNLDALVAKAVAVPYKG